MNFEVNIAGSVGRLGWLMAGTVASLAGASPAFAAGTQAGTQIENVATASYTPPGDTNAVTIESNKVILKVDELLDVKVAWEDPARVVVTSPSSAQKLKYTVTNTGNGPEKFALTTNAAVGGDQFDPTVVQIYLDSNGNGGYDEGIDVIYSGNEPEIAPDGNVTVFVSSNIPSGRADGDLGNVELIATAMTGSGTPGRVFAGQGFGGGDAVVGASTARNAAAGTYVVNLAMVTLGKTAAVTDPWGGTTRVPGSVITYTLVANLSGNGTLNGLQVKDVIPTGSTYVANSMTLGGTALTDSVSDADAGKFDGTAIAVALGDVAAPATRTVTFKVKID